MTTTIYQLSPNVLKALVKELCPEIKLRFIPIPQGSKGPFQHGWQHTDYSAADLPALGESFTYTNAKGEEKTAFCGSYGLLCGDGIFGVDIDSPEAFDMAKKRAETLTPTLQIFSPQGGRCKLIYLVPPEEWDNVPRKTFKDKECKELQYFYDGQIVICGDHINKDKDVDGEYYIKEDYHPITWLPTPLLEYFKEHAENKQKAKNPSQPNVTATQLPPAEEVKTTPAQVEVVMEGEAYLMGCIAPNHRKLIKAGVPDGQRNDMGAKISRDLIGTASWLEGKGYSTDPRSLFDRFCGNCQPPIDGQEADTIWHSAERSNPPPCLDEDKLETCLNKVLRDKGVLEESTANTKQRQDYETLLAFFNGRLRYNELTKSPELDGKPYSVAAAKLDLAVDHNLALRSSDDHVAGICLKIAQTNTYSPVQDYFEECFHKHGGTPEAVNTFETMAEMFFGTSAPLDQIYAAKTLISGVARTDKPGCKVDSCWVLQGKQGENKSTFFQKLLPNPDWVDDSLDLDTLGDKDSRLQQHSVFINELQEIEQLFFWKRQMGRFKAYLTSRVDRLRRPYGRSFETLPRSFILVGTTNHNEFLTDPTGNRRFWITQVHKQIPLEQVEAKRDLIWGEAVRRYKEGNPWWLSPEEVKQSAEASTKFESVDPWYDVVADYVDDKTQVSITDILYYPLDIAKAKHTRSDRGRVSTILTQLGWEKAPNPVSDPATGEKRRVWNKPSS